MKNALIIFGVLLVLLAPASVATAQEEITLTPDCGAAGDPVLIRGEGFGETPVVTFDGVEAEVLRSSATRILCLVPEETSLGPVDVAVDGDLADAEFTVLEDGSPVVIRMRPTTTSPGRSVFMIGRRLGGGTVTFLDSSGAEAAEVVPRGRYRVIHFEVPADLAPGTYTLLVTNADGLDTGDCSPELEVVEAGEPTLLSITPEEAAPGHRILISGTDLFPAGKVRVIWTPEAGDDLYSYGCSNGYDEVRSYVPPEAAPGATYEVAVQFLFGDDPITTGSISYTVGTPGTPEIHEMIPAAAPAGSLLRIRGANFFTGAAMPKVVFRLGDAELEARTLAAWKGFRNDHDEIVVQVPEDAADGTWEVVVVVGAAESAAEEFEVGVQPLTVTSMSPTSGGGFGWRPVFIEGSGFGPLNGGDLTVTWDDGGDEAPAAGELLFQTDNLVVVLPPRLAEGTYEVVVTRDPDGAAESVVAGTYTVNGRDGNVFKR